MLHCPSGGRKWLLHGQLEASCVANWCKELVAAGPEPGLTRDAVRVMWEWNGRAVELVDTAGWMRASKLDQYDDVGGVVAGMTVGEGQKALNRVHVVVLVLDALRCLNLSKVSAEYSEC